MIAETPKPPYYAVLFSSILNRVDDEYSETAERMIELAETMPGFLGAESARDGLGITVSYWESMDAIIAWKQHPEHVDAMKRGREEWYEAYTLRICKVEKTSEFNR